LSKLNRFEVGLNAKSLPDHARLEVMLAGSMCNYKVNLMDVSEVDEELIAWVKQAYESTG
jgi:hypothetical protein